MPSEEQIVLECPYCRGEIHQPLSWFKQAYCTCPACGGGLAAGQFAPLIDELEQAFEASVAEMVQGKPSCGCGCGKAAG